MGKTGDPDPNHDPNPTKESSMRNFPRHVFVGGLLAASLLASGYAAAADVFDEILEICLKEKKSTVIHVDGQGIAGRVVKVGTEAIEISSREYPRIVIKRERINAVASN